MAIDFDNLSDEELMSLAQQQGLRETPEKSIATKIAEPLRAAQEGFTGEIIETGEDLITAGRRFVTDPLGITDSEATAKRERTLGKERAAKLDAIKRAGLEKSYGLGKIGGTLATVAAPGGLASKGAGALIKGSGALRGAGRLAVGQGGLGAAVGAVKGQGDVEQRLSEAGKSAALFTAAGGAAGLAGKAIKGVATSPAVEQVLQKAKVPGMLSQRVQSAGAKKLFTKIEQSVENIPIVGAGIKNLKATQIDKINKAADELYTVSKAGKDLIRDSGKTINRIVSSSSAKVSDPKLVRSIERIKSGLKANGHTTALNKLNKKIPEADIKAMQEGSMSVKRLHELRRNIDDVVESIKSGSNVGGSKGGLVQLKGLRSNMESTLKKSIQATDKKALKQYMEAKKVFQEGSDSRLIENLMDKSFKDGEFNRTTFQNGLFTLKNRGKLSFQSKTKIRQLSDVMDDVIKVVGRDKAPKAGPRIGTEVGTMLGIGSAGAAGVVGGAPGLAALGAVALGARTLLSTRAGQKLFLRQGSKNTQALAELLLNLGSRVGAEQGREALAEEPVDTSSSIDFNNMSDEELLQRAKELGIR